MKSKVALAAMFALLACPAFAQKSQDTLRIGITAPLQAIDSYYFPQREWDLFYNAVYEPLVNWNDYKKEFVPQIAKSWKRIDDVTLDFQLRDDVTFHNGEKLTADDVVGTLKFAADPKYNFFNKVKFTWIKSVEKTGPFSLRLVANAPTAMDLMQISSAPIYNDAILSKQEDKAQYGRVSPVGTGPYKLTMVDKNKGAAAERFAGYKGPSWMRAPIGKVVGLPVPDRETQIAHLLTGDFDAIRDASVDEIKSLAQKPEFTATARGSYSYLIVQLDALNRSGAKELTDVRVRKAIFMGIDRKGILEHLVAGKDQAQMPDAVCQKAYRSCDYSTKPPAYDPAGAKKLLAQAGYPNGFDLEIVSLDVSRDYAVAIAGDLRKIGINASVTPANVVLFRKLRTDGKLAMYVGERPVPTPDTGFLMDLFFAAESMDYWRDPDLLSGLQNGARELDPTKRAGIYKAMVDRINEQAYMMPVTTLPTVFLHSKTVEFMANPVHLGQFDLSDFAWK